jgi:tetratricopeptide (TPR) repeat protein
MAITKGVKILVSLVFVLGGLLLAASVTAQTREIIATGEYVMGDGETMAVSEERARINAVRQAAEEAGTLVKSYSKVHNMTLQEDVVEVIANHAMKITVLSKNRALMGDALRFTVKIKAEISNADIDASLKRAADERQTIADYRKLKEEFERQSQMLETLKKQLATVPADQRKEVLGKIGENENQFRAALFLEEGLRRISALDNSGADTALTKAIELNPKLAQAYAARAEARLLFTDTPALMEDVNRAIALEPDNAGHYAVRARITAFKNCSEQNQKGCQEVIADIRKAKSLDPANPAYFTLLGAVYNALNQYDLAAKEYDMAVQMLPSATLPIAAVNTYIHRADFRLNAADGNYLQKALEDLNRAVSIISSPSYMTEDVKKIARFLKQDPKSEQEAFRLFKDTFGVDITKMNEAEKKDFQKDFATRNENARQVLNNAALIYWKRSQVLYESGDVKAAEKDRFALCELTLSHDGPLVYASGIIADADICTSKGVYRPFGSPKKLQAYQSFMRGQRLFARQKHAEAIAQFSRALELDSKLIQAYILRASSYEYSTPPSFEKAIADFTAVIKLDPKNARALYERGLAYWVRSKDMQWDEDEQGAKRERLMAQKDFSAVIQLAGNEYSSNALLQRGRIFETEKQFELAARDYDNATRLHGYFQGDFQIFLDKANVLEMAGKIGEAIQALDEYIAAARKNLAEKGEAGDAYLAGKIAEAEAHKRALSNPKEDR